jgi:fibronectin-binding autotransporter adhesin
MNMKKIMTLACMALVLFTAGTVGAADRYSSGTKTWDTATANWGTVPTGPYTAVTWTNANNDNAVFEGTAGTVTLGEPITVSNLTFSVVNYTVSASTLTFVGGTITVPNPDGTTTITSQIGGNPSVKIPTGTSNGYSPTLSLAPTSGSQQIGTITLCYANYGSGDKCTLSLGGTTTGNSVAQIGYANGSYAGVNKVGAGTWTAGSMNPGSLGVNISGGILIADGPISTTIKVSSTGELHIKNTSAVSGGLDMNGGFLDNVSGAAITTSTYNPGQTWNGDWTFIGVNGANSDLNLGTGGVTLTGTRTVTVSNALTTLTIGGVIGDGTSIFGVTKAGDGTLWLKAANTYNGPTTVTAGTLKLGNGTANTALDDTAVVSIASGAVLNLNFTGTDTVLALFLNGVLQSAGTYDSTTPGGYITGSGSLVAGDGSVAAGIYYWDGPNVGGTGDGLAAGGSGTWSTSNANWDHGLGARQVWPNTTNDKAIFRTTAGTVDLQSDITLGEILIDGVDNYVIGGTSENCSLHFGGATNIFVNGVHAEFKAGITGRPNLQCGAAYRTIVQMTADAASMTLGTVTIGAGSSSNPEFWIQGTNTESSATAIVSPFTYSFVKKYGTGTWTIGDIYVGQINLNAGKLVINGTSVTPWSGFNFNGGTLAGTGTINDAITVPAAGTIAPGNPTGTLTINSACIIDGKLAVTVNGASCSKLAVINSNSLTITNATLQVTVGSTPSSAVVIASYGSLVGAGTFKTITGMPASWAVDYTYKSNKEIALIPPPPGTVITFR